LKNDLLRTSQVHCGDGAGYSGFLKGPASERAIQPMPDPAQAKERGAFVAPSFIEARLIETGKRLLYLIRIKAGGVETSYEAAETGPSNRTDRESFPVEHTQDPDVGIALCPPAAQCQRDFHPVIP
jgi:hypothetical protein